MLVLTRKLRQSIMIGDDVEVSILAVAGDKVRLGISAPREVPVFRKEIYVQIHPDGGAPAGARLPDSPAAVTPDAPSEPGFG